MKINTGRVNRQDGAVGTFSLDDNGIKAGAIYGLGHLSTGIRFRIKSGLRRLGENPKTARPPDGASRAWPCRKY